MKLNDEVIAHIAKLLQIAILSGTDIVDNLRQIQLKEANGELYLNTEYFEQSESNARHSVACTGGISDRPWRHGARREGCDIYRL